jgi:bacteriorhodopsin
LFLTMLSNLDLLNVQANFSRTACWRQSSRWSRPARTLEKNPSWVWTGQR